MKRKLALLIIAVACFFQSGSFISASNEVERIRFYVSVVTEKGSNGNSNGKTREVLSTTTIDGPAGTDFSINLNTEGYTMKSKFLTELIAENELYMQVDLETRRLFGQSPNGLPLYEEDKQKQRLWMDFKEAVVLLPYGSNSKGRTLKIEITPELYGVNKNDQDSDRLKIDFQKKLASGEISIQARKVPHRYDVEAEFLLDGKIVARGNVEALLEDTKEISIDTFGDVTAELKGKKLKAKFSVDDFIRGRPKDLVSISFDLSDQNGRITNGKGMGVLGGNLTYQLDDDLENYEIRFRVTEKEEK